jgi:hypothetical protein
MSDDRNLLARLNALKQSSVTLEGGSMYGTLRHL